MSNDLDSLKCHFARIGAKVKFSDFSRSSNNNYNVDVISDKKGVEAYTISVAENSDVDFNILALDRNKRHLLLMVKQKWPDGKIDKHRYLCGHDERSWFVAAVPDASQGVTTVQQAKEALKPREVIEAQKQSGVKNKNIHRRKNRGFARQGEWFFVLAKGLNFDEILILRHEPLQRGAGKPHMAEFLVRRGGTTVYVCRRHPNGVEQETYERLIKEDPSLARAGWRVMRKNPEVYCRGRISHPDHATINLHGWHKVLPNTEERAPWMPEMTFID